jgi:hypothetical protein
MKAKENEFQLFLFLREFPTRSALMKVQSLSLKSQERYRSSHSSRSEKQAQKSCKVSVGSSRP